MMHLPIHDAYILILHYSQDANFTIHPGRCFIDLENLSIEWTVDDENLDAELLGCVDDTPDRYLEVPMLTHADHHDILQEFIGSEWTASQELRAAAKQAYAKVSIGAWLDGVNDSTREAYHDFRNSAYEARLTAFLNQHGLSPAYHY